MDGLLYLSGFLALLICLIGWRFIHQLKRKHIASGVIWSVQGLVVFLAFMLVLLVYSNLHTYQRLTYEAPIADVYLRQLGTQKFQLSLSFSEQDKDQRYFVLHGDQWQLDAKILKWKGWANLLGLDSFYQMDRVSGRYADISQGSQRLPSMYDLSAGETRGLDIWRMKQLFKTRISFVDTLFGQGVYMPMKDGAHFKVSIGQSGLLVRPENAIAKAAVF